ncbi:hypothetical protein ACVWZR_001832 [Bradyrhizobium sp. i1.3.1]
MKTSAWRRSSPTIIGGWLAIVEITVTARRGAAQPRPGSGSRVVREQHHLVDVLGELHGIDRKLVSMLPSTLRRPGVDEILGSPW